MLTSTKLKQELEAIVKRSCERTKLDPFDYPVKLMGTKLRYPNMKSAYYVHIANFKSLAGAKANIIEPYFRYSFRLIQFPPHKGLCHEIGFWQPIDGDMKNMRTIFKKNQAAGELQFEKMMTIALLMVDLNMLGKKRYTPTDKTLAKHISKLDSLKGKRPRRP